MDIPAIRPPFAIVLVFTFYHPLIAIIILVYLSSFRMIKLAHIPNTILLITAIYLIQFAWRDEILLLLVMNLLILLLAAITLEIHKLLTCILELRCLGKLFNMSFNYLRGWIFKLRVLKFRILLLLRFVNYL